jgi:RNA polymerase sigma factor (sigma-70 family)
VELTEQVERAQAGDIAAFTELTRRYQNLAFGYALTLLNDFHLAQDAVQEAFIAAYFHLGALQDAEAFPGWLRGIVRHRCHRILRKRHFQELPLEHAAALPAESAEPARALERDETRAAVLAAVAALPRAQREAITLYYIQEYSQREVAAFLGLPVSTVNNRLHAARARLKRRMVAMARETLKENALPEEFAEQIGKIVQVKGPVIEAQFDPDELPEIFSALTITDESRGVAVTVEVAQRLQSGLVRCIATSSVQGLRRGMKVVNTGAPSQATGNDAALESAIRALGSPTVDKSASVEFLETGIKVIDLLCPYVRGGKIGIFGETGIGMLVLVEELVQRIAAGQQAASLFTFVRPSDIARVHEAWTKDPIYTGGTVGALQTFYLSSEAATDAQEALAMGCLDAVTYMTRGIALLGLYPAVDPLFCTSRALDPAVVGQEHCEVARRVRHELHRFRELQGGEPEGAKWPDATRLELSRARKLQRFFSQPFYVAEPFTKLPARHVSREETIQGCRAILDGDCDDLPEQAFTYVGNLDEAREKAKSAKADFPPRQP